MRGPRPSPPPPPPPLTTPSPAVQDHAWAIGLVDEVHPEGDKVKEAAQTWATKAAAIPTEARAAVKLGYRTPLLEALKADRENDLDKFLVTIKGEAVQKNIAAYLAALKARSGKK